MKKKRLERRRNSRSGREGGVGKIEQVREVVIVVVVVGVREGEGRGGRVVDVGEVLGREGEGRQVYRLLLSSPLLAPHPLSGRVLQVRDDSSLHTLPLSIHRKKRKVGETVFGTQIGIGRVERVEGVEIGGVKVGVVAVQERVVGIGVSVGVIWSGIVVSFQGESSPFFLLPLFFLPPSSSSFLILSTSTSLFPFFFFAIGFTFNSS